MDIPIDLQTAWTISFFGNLFLVGLIGLMWWRASDYITAAIISWWKKTSIGEEWTKTGRYAFYATDIPKDYQQVIVLPKQRGIIELKRKSVGYDGNGNPISMFSTEHGITLNPEEITGERYFQITPKDHICYAYMDPVNEKYVKISKEEYDSGRYTNAKIFCIYPPHTVNPSEFVKYQKNNINPLVMEGYAKHREFALKKSMNAPISTFLSNNMAWIIPLLVVGAIVWGWMANNNAAVSANAALTVCQEKMVSFVQNPGGFSNIPPAITNSSSVHTGGAIVSH